MFLVFNKEKVTSYVVAFSTVAILLTMSILAGKESTLETSANYTNENIKTQDNLVFNQNIEKTQNNNLLNESNEVENNNKVLNKIQNKN